MAHPHAHGHRGKTGNNRYTNFPITKCQHGQPHFLYKCSCLFMYHIYTAFRLFFSILAVPVMLVARLLYCLIDFALVILFTAVAIAWGFLNAHSREIISKLTGYDVRAPSTEEVDVDEADTVEADILEPAEEDESSRSRKRKARGGRRCGKGRRKGGKQPAGTSTREVQTISSNESQSEGQEGRDVRTQSIVDSVDYQVVRLRNLTRELAEIYSTGRADEPDQAAAESADSSPSSGEDRSRRRVRLSSIVNEHENEGHHSDDPHSVHHTISQRISQRFSRLLNHLGGVIDEFEYGPDVDLEGEESASSVGRHYVSDSSASPSEDEEDPRLEARKERLKEVGQQAEQPAEPGSAKLTDPDIAREAEPDYAKQAEPEIARQAEPQYAKQVDPDFAWQAAQVIVQEVLERACKQIELENYERGRSPSINPEQEDEPSGNGGSPGHVPEMETTVDSVATVWSIGGAEVEVVNRGSQSTLASQAGTAAPSPLSPSPLSTPDTVSLKEDEAAKKKDKKTEDKKNKGAGKAKRT